MADGFEDFYYSSQDGLRLHARIYGGAIAGPLPVVCLAGLTRNAADFHELALHLSRRAATSRTVAAFDYRGRGDSAWDADRKNYNPVAEARDVLTGLDALGIARAALIGTSRGGLVTFAVAGLRPAAIAASVLNDIGPVVESAGLAAIHAYLQGSRPPASFAEAAAVAKARQGNAFPALADADWERAARAYWREADGGLAASYDPALLDQFSGLDLTRPLPAAWPQFDALSGVPVMAIRGANSDLLSEATLAEMARRHPGLEAVTVAGQGHAPLLETAGLPQRIEAFLDRAAR